MKGRGLVHDLVIEIGPNGPELGVTHAALSLGVLVRMRELQYLT